MGLPVAPLVRYIERLYPDTHRECNHDRHHDSVVFMLAELTGLTTRTVSRVISGEHPTASVDTIDRICAALGTHPAVIYGRMWTHKVCKQCGEEKPLDKFNRNQNNIKNICRHCERGAKRRAG